MMAETAEDWSRNAAGLLTPGDLWRGRLAEVRRHLLTLKESGLVGDLAWSWTPETRQGYAAELRAVIGAVIGVLTDVEDVIEAVDQAAETRDQDLKDRLDGGGGEEA
jgi:hypothetical protein